MWSRRERATTLIIIEMQTILLVEDDPEITRTLGDFLRSEGFAVTAADGQRAECTRCSITSA